MPKIPASQTQCSQLPGHFSPCTIDSRQICRQFPYTVTEADHCIPGVLHFRLNPNASNVNQRYLVSGLVDWALGYSPKDEDGALLVAVEVKQRAEFSSGESQLVAYLAILRENRRRAGKTNIVTQGFYSDGTRFGFICIKDSGAIMMSPPFDIQADGGLKMVFSFIVTMIDAAMRSTPTASPTKPGVTQDKEINNFEDEVWGKVYKLMDESLVVVDDDDMDDVLDL